MESLQFAIVLSGTSFKGKYPEYTVLLNGNKAASGTVTEDSATVTFTADLEDDQPHLLEICLINKGNRDTIVAADGSFTEDLLLNIEKIEIDGIDLGALIWTHSKFVGDNASTPVLTGCVNLGWNGRWKLPFNTPFYIWLLESM